MLPEDEVPCKKDSVRQLDLFTDYDALEKENEKKKVKHHKEQLLQQTVLHIKKAYGKDAILKGINFAEGATMKERNKQIGGHKA